MVSRKVSLDGGRATQRRSAGLPASTETVELFFNSGIVYHEVPLPDPLPDVIAGFMVVQGEGTAGHQVRAAGAGEDPDVEIGAVEHLAELGNRWLPLPYQLSCPHAVQVYLAPQGARAARALLAVDTLEAAGSGGRHLDASLDAGRPFRPLAPGEAGSFLDRGETREFLRRLEKAGVERAPFKYAALLQLLAPLMPRLQFVRRGDRTPIDVSLVLDFGNSRSSAVLVESRESAVFSVPLQVRDSSNPFRVTDETWSSRITFLPSPFDPESNTVAVGASFSAPSIARLGREALDRALETPHRYSCSLSGPKRYLWDGEQTDDPWYFAAKQGADYATIHGKILKFIQEGSGGLALRSDGPATPADPRYAPRAMMLFAMVEILSQAYAQVSSDTYRKFQGKEANPRVLRHVVLTFPSAMRKEEKEVYETLLRNAAVLTCHVLGIPREDWPNGAGGESPEPFLFVDEALATQMVHLYQEVIHSYSGAMEEFVGVYGRRGGAVRIASIDIGGGTSDVMIAEYEDRLPGTGTALHIRKLFQDGVSIAGDDVCRAIVEDIVFDQILQQIPSMAERHALIQLFSEGVSEHGAQWRTLRAKLVPYYWMPLARCYWALGEGFAIPDHHPEKLYTAPEIFEIFENPDFSPKVEEADRFITSLVPSFPGFNNVQYRFDLEDVSKSIDRVLREPLRRYADIIAQFDVDLLILAGRTSALRRVHELFVLEMPVAPPRIKMMSAYRVDDWYPMSWRRNGMIKDPKSTVTAGAMILHLAARNRLPGLLLDAMTELEQRPIYGLYQSGEPHIARANELFRDERVSRPFPYTGGMVIGFRNVDSEEMDGSPLFEVRPATPEVEAALLEDRVDLRFKVDDNDQFQIVEVKSHRGVYSFEPSAFRLALKTATVERYWLDSGQFRPSAQVLEENEDGRA